MSEEEHKQRHKKCMKEYRKSWCNSVKELKRVDVVAVYNLIKDEVERFSDAQVYTDDDDSEEDRVIGLR